MAAWISVKDALPKDWTWCWTLERTKYTCPKTNTRLFRRVGRSGKPMKNPWAITRSDNEVTHWIEIPEIPESVRVKDMTLQFHRQHLGEKGE